MKIKYLFGAAAALMIAACSQDELVSVKQDGIAYSVTAATQTRAADSYCNNVLPESFKVWARTTDGNLYINGDVIKNESGVWTDQAGTRYWPETKALDFYAQVNGDAEFRLNDGAPAFENFTVNDDVTRQVDLIYSVKKGQTKPESADKKVILNFRHALSQVCFRARNNMKNMSVEVTGVSVGHLTNTGTFALPTESTDENYIHHDDTDDNTKTLNGGVWTIPADAAYNKRYDVSPIGGSVVLPADSKTVMNLTCPAKDHENDFAQVLTLLPQEVNAWDPTVKASDYNGAYFLVKVVLSNIVKNDDGADVATVVYDGYAAVPVNVNWEQGYRYIYTFVFDEGGDGGWTPDPSDPKPVLTSVKYDVTVDDFIPVEKDDTKMDSGKKDDADAETTYTLTYDANGGEFKSGITDTTHTAKSKEASYTFTVINDSKFEPVRADYNLIGWADAADATVATIAAGETLTLTKDANSKTLYAVWEEVKTDEEWLDLGLPSGNLWRNRNIGADKETDFGGYYAWGESEEFNSTKYSDYKAYWIVNNIGYYTSYQDTQYDTAFQLISGTSTPDQDDWEELVNNCDNEKSSWTTKDSVEGVEFFFANGKSIFFPAAGYKNAQGESKLIGTGCRYWSSEFKARSDGKQSVAACLGMDPSSIYNDLKDQYFYFKTPIRPIKKK